MTASTHALAGAAAVLSAAAEDGVDPSESRPGYGMLALFVFLVVAGFVLWRSLRKHLRRIDFTEDGEEPTGSRAAADDRPARDGQG